MLRTRKKVLSALLASAFLIHTPTIFAATITATSPADSFDDSEHISLGDNVKVFLSANDPGQAGPALHLPNGLTITYGEILAMGDLYGVPGKSISLGKSNAELRERFLADFNSFAKDSAAVPEAPQLIAVLRDEQKTIADGLKNGEKIDDIFKRIGDEPQRKLNCLTGGGCTESGWWLQPGRYLNLAKEDYDHFNFNAWVAYRTGHQIALEEAAAAGKSSDGKRLELAYAMNAFACHFLSDRFSAGHIRTPRLELATNITPSLTGTILANYMHNEEDAAGIHVHNLRGDRWVAFGDRSYFNPNNGDNRAFLQEALQISANEIFAAYKQGVAADVDEVYTIIPEADEVANASKVDISPLFYWDSNAQKLMRRQDMTNVFDRNWTASWWGWSTLAELAKERGVPHQSQAALAQAGLGEKALAAGLISEPTILNFIKKQKA